MNEGMSNTILEAMACGLPVVATSVGGNEETVQHGKTGLLVRPGSEEALLNGIQWYMDREEKRVEHGKNGRKEAEKEFSVKEMVRKYEEMYRDVLYGKRERTRPAMKRRLRDV
jgi:glycosyltransferase involved in cell wall biosynthesis